MPLFPGLSPRSNRRQGRAGAWRSVFVQPVMFSQPARELQPPLIDHSLEIFAVQLIALAQGCQPLDFFATEAAQRWERGIGWCMTIMRRHGILLKLGSGRPIETKRRADAER